MADRNDAILKLMEKPLGPEDTFRFRCKQCGSCCKDRIDILLEKPLLPQVKENGAKALGIVSGIDDMMKMFGH